MIKFSFQYNRKSIKDINRMFKSGELIVDDSYQRKAIWSPRDDIRLMETILLNLVVPVLFFWKNKPDPETGESTTHIVDGQQRINAIMSFLDGKYALKKDSLLEKTSKELFGDKYFQELTDSERSGFWAYDLTIVDIDSEATISDIKNMFLRLNLTDYNLNDQEKRNSKSGEFDILVKELSNLEFWDENNLFKISEIKRMKDIEFCASIVLLYKKGIINQTDQKPLNDAYETYKVNYSEALNDKNDIICAIQFLVPFITAETKRFVQRKSQLYSLFSLIFYTMREKIEINANIINNYVSFVKLYDKFTNEMVLDNLTLEEKELFDDLKKYKLASSEGVNKQTNRMIRFNVLKKFCFELSDTLLNGQKTLLVKMESNKQKVDEEVDEDF